MTEELKDLKNTVEEQKHITNNICNIIVDIYDRIEELKSLVEKEQKK